MKKNRFEVIILFCLSINTFSYTKEIALGIKSGVNLSTLWVSNPLKNEDFSKYYPIEVEEQYKNKILKPGLDLVILLEIGITGHFSIQPELKFSKKGMSFYYKESTFNGYDSAFTEYNYIYNVNYLEFPLPIKLTFPTNMIVKPAIYFGPFFGIKTMVTMGNKAEKADEITTELWTDRKMNHSINTFDFGVVVGPEIKIKVRNNNILFDIRYTLGLSNINKNYDWFGNGNYKNVSLSFMVGYLYDF